MTTLITDASGPCVNIRDNGRGNTCSHQLKSGESCWNYLEWKDCDKSCNLCACSTASGTIKQHCSGHGTCLASCTQNKCTDAFCRCHFGYFGDKCQKSIYN